MTNKELSETFEYLSQLKIKANAVANNKSLTQIEIETAISIYEEEYNIYEHLLSHDHLISGELVDLKAIISKLKDRLK